MKNNGFIGLQFSQKYYKLTKNIKENEGKFLQQTCLKKIHSRHSLKVNFHSTSHSLLLQIHRINIAS